MSIVLFIRHGENEYVRKGRLAGRLPEIHLNKNGLKQAVAVAKALRDLPVKAVYSSPLERTMETAMPIANALRKDVILSEGLIEVDFGKWQGKKISGLKQKKRWKVVQGAPSRMRFPGGESFASAQGRVCQELEYILEFHGWREILVCVTHSDIIKLAVAFYIGLPLDMFQRLSISPASITALQLSESGSRLLVLNKTIDSDILWRNHG